ncbi:ABC transporter substrate-binding protein [Helicobacter turcicus]|uniref:ABC transporter substrate-binding protein n=1 Tax=Helicobacter turcicus TaxID=2867412 RepID=A0ABS7JLN9_9HELI|nr:ABC transporter substrate-binding protein [Helicobacter turcicus]MBX7490303.1 ABC transporter substrate-binding protein [Helicobacter turcicus]MBX7545118.1 ABC transporter substrate-binding protein [Helicobacter turcicus]
MQKLFKLFVFALLSAITTYAHTITDMRGKQIEIPEKLERVATISDGFIEGVMTHLGVIDKVNAIGSWSMKRDYKYTFESIDGKTYTARGWHTMKYLHPWLDNLPCFNSPQGNIINYETLAKANPQIVILRVGDCTVSGGSYFRGGDPKALEKTIAMIESLGIPLVVLYSPTYYGKAELSTMQEEIRVIGDIFKQREKALKLYDYLHSTELLVRNRTKNIQDKDKPNVLYFGLNSVARKQGGSGMASGITTPESHIIENITNAKNAFRGKGNNIILSGEQVYAIDPDIILLPTQNGYHPASELLSAPYYQNLQELKAIKNKRVYALPWSPMNCSRRVEYPLDILIIAKASYPHLFEDIKVHTFALKFYQDVYHVDENTAKILRSEQLLDWTIDNDF